MKCKIDDIIKDKFGNIGKVINLYQYNKEDTANEDNTVVEFEDREYFDTHRVLMSEVVEILIRSV